MKKEIQSLIAQQMLLDQGRGTASVFLLNKKRIATLIMSEAEPNSGSLENYAFFVIKEFQQLGLGSQILDSVLNCYLNTDIYARFSPASESMQKLLVDRSFTLVATDVDHKILKREYINSCGMVEPMHSRPLVASDAGI
jgi:GNAT superfamily N-acetyltransferase